MYRNGWYLVYEISVAYAYKDICIEHYEFISNNSVINIKDALKLAINFWKENQEERKVRKNPRVVFYKDGRSQQEKRIPGEYIIQQCFMENP